MIKRLFAENLRSHRCRRLANDKLVAFEVSCLELLCDDRMSLFSLLQMVEGSELLFLPLYGSA